MNDPAASDTPSDVDLMVPGTLFVLAELQAMTIDGVLAPVFGQAFHPAGAVETPGLRAAALAFHVPAALAHRAALGQLSAAWVYGCASPPQVISLLQGHGGKSASLPPFSGCTLRQVNLEAGDVQTIGGIQVTGPLRTALDVARTAPEDIAREVLERMAARAALRCPLERVGEALRTAAHVPGKLRGQELLRGMLQRRPGAVIQARRWEPVER
ncbi:hypothetical protein AAGW05_10115 [Arthrobacter sp. LAPM80]|uniref:hypothetical protein n=1 Tax=Arthrobacter sp. LAPM80 TaxID=3141788 RepID=UPI00398B4B91